MLIGDISKTVFSPQIFRIAKSLCFRNQFLRFIYRDGSIVENKRRNTFGDGQRFGG